MFSRIALMLRYIHFGGASSGIRSIIFPKSMPPQCPAPRRISVTRPSTATPATT